MISRFLIRTNYLNHYSLRLLLGNLLLTVPALCAIVIILIWENLAGLIVLPFTLVFGIILIYPTLSLKSRPSKEQVAVDILKMTCGFIIFILLSIQPWFIKHSLKEREIPSKAQAPCLPKLTYR